MSGFTLQLENLGLPDSPTFNRFMAASKVLGEDNVNAAGDSTAEDVPVREK